MWGLIIAMFYNGSFPNKGNKATEEPIKGIEPLCWCLVRMMSQHRPHLSERCDDRPIACKRCNRQRMCRAKQWGELTDARATRFIQVTGTRQNDHEMHVVCRKMTQKLQYNSPSCLLPAHQDSLPQIAGPTALAVITPLTASRLSRHIAFSSTFKSIWQIVTTLNCGFYMETPWGLALTLCGRQRRQLCPSWVHTLRKMKALCLVLQREKRVALSSPRQEKALRDRWQDDEYLIFKS